MYVYTYIHIHLSLSIYIYICAYIYRNTHIKIHKYLDAGCRVSGQGLGVFLVQGLITCRFMGSYKTGCRLVVAKS